MTQDSDLPSLIAAARKLFALGRQESARIFLDRVLRDPAGDALLAADYARAVAAAETGFAEAGLQARIAVSPAAAAEIRESSWAALQAHGAGRPFDPALFQARLARIVAQPDTGPSDKGPSDTGPSGTAGFGPDLCYVLAYSLPQDRTGYSMRSQALVTALQEIGLSVHCLTQPGFPWTRSADAPAMPSPAPTDVVGPVTYHRSGGPQMPPPDDLPGVLAAEAALVAAFAQLRPRQVMAASNHANAIPALFAARRCGLPFIYEIRGFWELSRASRWPAFRSSDEFRRIRALETAVATAADLVFVLSAAMRDDLIARGVPAARIALLPNAADPVRLQPQPRDAALAARIGLPADVVTIGYAGTFHPYEGLDDLVAACATLFRQGHDFRLLIIGKEPRPDIHIGAQLRAMAQDADFVDRLIMPGEVPADEIAAWYGLIDIAPIPRKFFEVTDLVAPLKPFEAMAMEKCVVVPDLAALSEIVRHEETGLVYARDRPDSLAAALARVLDDAGLRQRLSRQARAWILRERNWQAIAGLYARHAGQGRALSAPAQM